MNHPLKSFLFCPKCGSQDFEEADGQSKHCRHCGFTYYFNAAAATVAFILNEQHELLVCRRANEPAKGSLDLPGGFISLGETAEEGVAREVMEETGLAVKEAHYLFSFPNRYPYSNLTIHTLDLFFRCEVESARGFQAMDDAAELFFLPLEEIRIEEFGLASIRNGLEKFIDSLSQNDSPCR